ncbi:hypothetical protein [Streptomyces capoamus]|uniref:hypothetical protein n=1 Tax=Streptomyces capoamus TaxID=68183 RepID=UPI00339655FD
MTAPWYATREDIMHALDVQTTARNRRQIDAALEAASRAVEGLCHRQFYPSVDTKYFDWPTSQYRPSWRLWLDDSTLISLTSVTSGGVAIDLADVLLEPNRSGPPYTRLELNIGTSAAWGGGSTYQRDITITGLWGYRNDETTLGALTAAVPTSTATTVTVDGPTSAAVGVGSVLRLDSERLLVTERRQTSTGQTGTLTASKGDTTLTVADGTAFAVDEVLLLDAERVRVDDIAGNTLVVERAYDGTVLAAHAAATIYAPRTLTVTRGALGTTATAHSGGATVYVWQPPGLIRQLVKAEAIWALLQERAGWFRKSSTAGNSSAEVSRSALDALRDQAYTEHGRKARHRGI